MKTLKLLGIIFSTLLIILMGLIGAELLKDPPYPEFETPGIKSWIKVLQK